MVPEQFEEMSTVPALVIDCPEPLPVLLVSAAFIFPWPSKLAMPTACRTPIMVPEVDTCRPVSVTA